MTHIHTGHGPDKKNDCHGCQDEYWERQRASLRERFAASQLKSVVIVLSDEPYEASRIFGVFKDMDAVHRAIPGDWRGHNGEYEAYTHLPDHLRVYGSANSKFFLRAETHNVESIP